jgi:hypothetical protein
VTDGQRLVETSAPDAVVRAMRDRPEVALRDAA